MALAFLWAANRIDPAVPFPPLSLGERIIRITPGAVATYFIETLGHNAVRILVVGTTVGFLALAAVLARLSMNRGSTAVWLAAAVLAIAAAAAAFADPLSIQPLPALAGSAVGGWLYGASLNWLAEWSSNESGEDVDHARRRILAYLGLAAAGVALGGTLLGRLARRLAGPDTDVAIRAADQPAASPHRPPFPRIAGLSPEVTSPADHYVVDIDLRTRRWKPATGCCRSGGWSIARCV